MLHNIIDAITGKNHGSSTAATALAKIKGTVVLMKKNVLDFSDFHSSLLDGVHEFLGKGVSFQLVSATAGDPNKGNSGKLGKAANWEEWITMLTSVAAGESLFNVTFEWEESELGTPGAVVVKNNHHSEFYLKTITLEGVPGKGRVHFVCNSWVYPAKDYDYDRVFFTNDTYLPDKFPEPLKPYIEEELQHLRGDNVNRQLKEHDRVYGYAYYNDLGEPDKGDKYARPVLGGSKDHPYPRRCLTGRPPAKIDPKSESRLPLVNGLDIYVPRDERFGHLKMSDFLAYALKALTQALLPTLNTLFDATPMEFNSFQDMLNLYEGGINLPPCPELDEVRNKIPFEMIKELVRTDGEQVLKLPLPQVIKEDRFAWRTDEEFGREMLAGLNPVIIRRLQALNDNKLFILDHHDSLMPYLNRINAGANKIYATRTLLLLQNDGTLKPLAIELSLPNLEGEQLGAVNKVFTPADHGVEASVWQLAKAYVGVNDIFINSLRKEYIDM